jgi:ABC-type antimicrobial peptide transport system permease subunit
MVIVRTVVGVPLAWGLSWMIRTELYGVQPWDWMTTAAAALMLCGVSALAGLVPARRATSIDPIQALRTE